MLSKQHSAPRATFGWSDKEVITIIIVVIIIIIIITTTTRPTTTTIVVLLDVSRLYITTKSLYRKSGHSSAHYYLVAGIAAFKLSVFSQPSVSHDKGKRLVGSATPNRKVVGARVSALSIQALCKRGKIQVLVRGGSTMNDLEMSWCSWRGDAEGVPEGKCESGLNPLSLGAGGLPHKLFKLWVFFCAALRTPQLYFKDRTFPLIWRKLEISQING